MEDDDDALQRSPSSLHLGDNVTPPPHLRLVRSSSSDERIGQVFDDDEENDNPSPGESSDTSDDMAALDDDELECSTQFDMPRTYWMSPNYPVSIVMRPPHADVVASSVWHYYAFLEASYVQQPLQQRILNARSPRECLRLLEAASDISPRSGDESLRRRRHMLEATQEKYRQHPELAGRLLATRHARLAYRAPAAQPGARLWSAPEHWMGYLLELVREQMRHRVVAAFPRVA